MDKNYSTLVLCAMRYTLGRRAYMPSIMQEYIMTNIKELDTLSIKCMIQDIESAARYEGGCGDENIDKPGWIKLLKFLRKELEQRKD